MKSAAYPGGGLSIVGTQLPADPVVSALRRIAGDGLLNLLCARAEVHAALRAWGGAIPSFPPIADEAPPESIPSVAAGRRDDRVIAEIDQDGFASAVDPADEARFGRRPGSSARQRNPLDVVLLEGRLCIRKRFRLLRPRARHWGNRSVPAGLWLRRNLWTSLGLFFYNEAAALLRLRDLPFVPRLRRIDLAGRALYFDYIRGESLREEAARSGAPVYDRDVAASPHLAALSGRDLERREVELLEGAGAGDFRREIFSMACEIAARGVAPLDIKLGNFIRGGSSGRLYWIDFEISRLSSQPRWEADLAVERQLLDELFEFTDRGYVL